MMNKERHNELKQVQKEWRDISVVQLSNVNNILITLSSGLLAYFITKNNNPKIVFDSTKTINWSLILYWSGIIFLGISICYGIAVLISRLYDFRISRQIALIRQRYFKEKGIELPWNDLGNFGPLDRIKAFTKILLKELPRITTEQIRTNADINDNFNQLRKLTKILGTCTWRWTKMQLFFFFISGLLIFLYHI